MNTVNLFQPQLLDIALITPLNRMYIVQLTENCKEKSSIFAALQTPTLFRLSLVQFSVNDTLDAVNYYCIFCSGPPITTTLLLITVFQQQYFINQLHHRDYFFHYLCFVHPLALPPAFYFNRHFSILALAKVIT